ncbi:MAG TPA: formate dehydrogenase [Porticoccaceae bacterium]|nr:formate dehydrogenase [Porticoccaceae bacterium]
MANSSIEHLVKMANQIAASVPAISDTDRTTQAAAHIKKFWSPIMLQTLTPHLENEQSGLSTTARNAIKKALE